MNVILAHWHVLCYFDKPFYLSQIIQSDMTRFRLPISFELEQVRKYLITDDLLVQGNTSLYSKWCQKLNQTVKCWQCISLSMCLPVTVLVCMAAWCTTKSNCNRILLMRRRRRVVSIQLSSNHRYINTWPPDQPLSRNVDRLLAKI